MTNELELKTIWELNENGSLDQLVESIQKFLIGIVEASNPIQGINNDLLLTQVLVAIIAAIMIGVTFLPFGATTSSIQACQLNTDKKLLKAGGALIVISTSLATIFFLQILKLNQMLGNI